MSRTIGSDWVLANGVATQVTALVEIDAPPGEGSVWRNFRWEPEDCWYLSADGEPYSGDCQFDGEKYDDFIPARPVNAEWDAGMKQWVAVEPGFDPDLEDWVQLAADIFETDFDEWMRGLMTQHPEINMDATFIISSIVSGRPNIERLKMSWMNIMLTAPAPLEKRIGWQAVLDRDGIKSIAFVAPHELAQ